MKTLQSDTLLLISEVATRLRVNDSVVYYWIDNSLITYVKLPQISSKPIYRIWESTLVNMGKGELCTKTP